MAPFQSIVGATDSDTLPASPGAMGPDATNRSTPRISEATLAAAQRVKQHHTDRLAARRGAAVKGPADAGL
jgi:hypothetical protein